MSFRIEKLLKPYEFEKKANVFLESVVELAKDFSDILVEAENKTTEDLNGNGSTIKRLITTTNTKKILELYKTGYQMEVDSAFENQILICIYGNKKKNMVNFAEKADALSKSFDATRTLNSGIKDNGYVSQPDDYRYFWGLIYSFK